MRADEGGPEGERDREVGGEHLFIPLAGGGPVPRRQIEGSDSNVLLTGGDPLTADVDIQFQLAFPLVNLIVVLMGIVLASGPRKTTIASGFGLTLLISYIISSVLTFFNVWLTARLMFAPGAVAPWANSTRTASRSAYWISTTSPSGS